MSKLLLLFISTLLAQSSIASRPNFVLELCRHGARAPLEANYDNSWPFSELGDLTPVGMRQHYILGSAIYKQYAHLLESPQFKDSVYILSDSVDRCIQSASSQFFGIYFEHGPTLPNDYPIQRAVPPYNSPYINKTLKELKNTNAFPARYYPSIVNYVSNSAESLMFNTDSPSVCPMVNLWWAQNFIDEKAQLAWQAFQPLIQYLNSFGVNITNAPQFVNFGDTFFCNYYDDRALPFGIPYSEDLFINMSFAFSWWQAHVWEGQAYQQQSNAFGFANGFIDYLQAYLNGSNPAKFVLLSGHDNNIHTLLTPLKIVYDDCVMENYETFWANGTIPNPNCHFPWFASTLKVELYNETTPYIRFFYEDNLITLCGNDRDCTVVEFIALLQNITGNMTYAEYEANCNGGSGDQDFLKFEAVEIEGSNSPRIFELAGKDLIILGLGLVCITLGGLFVAERKNRLKELERNRTPLLI